MSEKLKGSLIKRSGPASLLRGSLVGSVEPSAMSSLKGSLLGERVTSSETQPVPDAYDMPPETIARVIAKRDNPELKHTVDPDGVVAPGLLLDSATSPGKRRLVTNLYVAPKGNTIATVHTEGQAALQNFGLEALHQHITEGQLIPIVPPVTES